MRGAFHCCSYVDVSATVLRARAVLLERLLVDRRAVALVRGEIVCRIVLVHLYHHAVTGDLGDDGGGGDRGGDAVALPHREARGAETVDREAVGEDVSGTYGQAGQGSAQRRDVGDVQAHAVALGG